MSPPIDTSGQWNEFFKKKGDLLVELSENHYMNKEYRKTLELLNQAHGMYVKAGATEFAEKTKAKFTQIKEKHFTKK